MPEFEPIHCNHDGLTLEGFIARPAGPGPHPAVLVMHSALGIRHMTRDIARKLAGEGYLAVATDMYGQAADISEPTKAGEHYMALLQMPEVLRARTVRWLETVAALDGVDASRMAAIGYCFGGQCVLELARSGAEVKAVVSYHGGLGTHAPAQMGAIKGEVVAYCGAQDPWAPVDHIDTLRGELTAAGASWHISTHGDAAHGFTDPRAEGGMPGIAYHALTDRLSWAGTMALFGAVLA